MKAYVFPGMRVFVDRVAGSEERPSIPFSPQSLSLQASKAQDSWHIKRLSDALGQLTAMLPHHRAGKIEHIEEVFGSLRLAYKAAEMAISEVMTALEDQEQRVIEPIPEALVSRNGSYKKGK